MAPGEKFNLFFFFLSEILRKKILNFPKSISIQ